MRVAMTLATRASHEAIRRVPCRYVKVGLHERDLRLHSVQSVPDLEVG